MWHLERGPLCKLLNVLCVQWAWACCRAAPTSFTLILWPFHWISMCRERKYGCVSFAKDEWTRGTLEGRDTPDVNQRGTRLYLFPVIYNWTFWVSGLTRFLERELRGRGVFSYPAPCQLQCQNLNAFSYGQIPDGFCLLFWTGPAFSP